MNFRDTNMHLLKVLGITDPHVIEIKLEGKPLQLPVVTITRHLHDGLTETTQQFDLVLREAPALEPAAATFDLDAMVATAQNRLAAALQRSVEQHYILHLLKHPPAYWDRPTSSAQEFAKKWLTR